MPQKAPPCAQLYRACSSARARRATARTRERSERALRVPNPARAHASFWVRHRALARTLGRARAWARPLHARMREHTPVCARATPEDSDHGRVCVDRYRFTVAGLRQSVACRPLEARPILPKNAAAALSQELVNRLQGRWVDLSYLLAGGDVHPNRNLRLERPKVQKGPRKGPFERTEATQRTFEPLDLSFFRSKSSRCYRVPLRWRPRRVWAWASCSPKTLPAATTRRRGVAPTG